MTSPNATGRGYGRFLSVGLRAGRGLTLLLAVLVLLTAAAPLVAAVAVGAVVGEVPQIARHGLGSPAGWTALWWVFAAGGVLLVQLAAASLQTAAASALGERIDASLQRELMDVVMVPEGIGHLEDPATVDMINVGRDSFRGSWGRPGRLASTVSRLATSRITLAGACVVLARFQPVLAVAVLAAALWAARVGKAASRDEAAHHYGSTELSRRVEYYYQLAATPAAAKEVRVFGLGRFLAERFTSTWGRSMTDVITPLPGQVLTAAAVLGSAVLGGVAWIAWAAADGRIAPGLAAVYIQALMLSLIAVGGSSWGGLQTELAMATLRRFDEAVTTVLSARTGTPEAATAGVHDLPRRDIRFEGVSFRYPGGGGDVFSGLDLVIPAGTSLAIVGANGAGKTTLVKLLCRLYEPLAGRICADGVDLAGLDVAAWRRRLAVAFQDAARFPLSARVNIGFGRVDVDDLDGVAAAADDAGVAAALRDLAEGWDTTLSPQYAGGADLSGGEWQKVALARALFGVRHGAGVLILDEPAANLDARSEARLYDQFLDLTRGLTTIVISHRFSSVRLASRIAVLEDGRVAEQGTHDELVELGGRYATMFRLQAARFSDPAGEAAG